MPIEAQPPWLQTRGGLLLLWAMLAVTVALLFAAWTQPLLTVRVSAVLPAILPDSMRQLMILDETRSVVTMAQRLYETDYGLIATLIVVFALVLPIAKNIGVGLLLASRPGGRARNTAALLQFVGRFAMVDIFAVGITVSIIGASTIGQGQSAPVQVETLTVLQSGFYIFVGYVLFSIAVDVLLALRFRQPDAGFAGGGATR